MSNFSRRLFLILLGGLATSGIAQSSDAASTKKPTPTPTPKKKTPKKPTPTPKKTTSKKPTPTPTTKKPTPTPSQSAKATPSPTPSPSKALEGIFIAKSSDLPMRQTKVFFLVDSFGISTSYSLLRTSNGIFAFDTRCTHAGAPTSLSGGQLKCPAHGSIFNPETGQVVSGPAMDPLKSYRTVEANGEIRIIIS
jgi:nitrite reductase/ring-hydroxylating ferredoxin subunit